MKKKLTNRTLKSVSVTSLVAIVLAGTACPRRPAGYKEVNVATEEFDEGKYKTAWQMALGSIYGQKFVRDYTIENLDDYHGDFWPHVLNQKRSKSLYLLAKMAKKLKCPDAVKITKMAISGIRLTEPDPMKKALILSDLYQTIKNRTKEKNKKVVYSIASTYYATLANYQPIIDQSRKYKKYIEKSWREESSKHASSVLAGIAAGVSNASSYLATSPNLSGKIGQETINTLDEFSHGFSSASNFLNNFSDFEEIRGSSATSQDKRDRNHFWLECAKNYRRWYKYEAGDLENDQLLTYLDGLAKELVANLPDELLVNKSQKHIAENENKLNLFSGVFSTIVLGLTKDIKEVNLLSMVRKKTVNSRSSIKLSKESIASEQRKGIDNQEKQREVKKYNRKIGDPIPEEDEEIPELKTSISLFRKGIISIDEYMEIRNEILAKKNTQ